MKEVNDEAGYIIYADNTPLTVCITDKKRANLAYNVLAIMGENDATYFIDGKENPIGPDIRIVDKDGNIIDPELDKEWFGYPEDNNKAKEAALDKIMEEAALEGKKLDRDFEADMMDQYTVCTYDDNRCSVCFAPLTWDMDKAVEMQNLMVYGMNPFVDLSFEGHVIDGVHIINEDGDVYDDRLNNNWAREIVDDGQDFADAVASIPTDDQQAEL